MDCEILTTPSGIQLDDGTVVMLARFPGTKWVVRYGWYTYNEKQSYGWYFVSIPANTVLPVTEDDLVLLTVISDDRCWGCVPNPYKHPIPPKPPCPDTPPHPNKPPYPDPGIVELRNELDKSFITVQNILERDRLKYLSLIPDGKLVRVNHVYDENEEDIGPKYYRYDKESETFIEIFIENGEIEEELSELKIYVDELAEKLEWVYLKVGGQDGDSDDDNPDSGDDSDDDDSNNATDDKDDTDNDDTDDDDYASPISVRRKNK